MTEDQQQDVFKSPVESGFGPIVHDVVRERESIDRTERLISAIERLTETIQALLERESDS